ncbi:DDE-type integrase/transposase/recombinase [Actinomyces mediterranea]|uniref:DDE-type integrase/transposase/recombinase n=1 Tax=Actinomyces mediterranea TaxID=1871028 RepID=UPI0009FB0F10|nr:DDE-type integrase/transposase/recombinase [Actinomyces mediterranea]
MGYVYVRSVIDVHSCVVCSEFLNYERGQTTVGVFKRAVGWYAVCDIRRDQVISGNGSAYRSRAWTLVCIARGIAAKRIRPYGSQSNGKIERLLHPGRRLGLMPAITAQKPSIERPCD